MPKKSEKQSNKMEINFRQKRSSFHFAKREGKKIEKSHRHNFMLGEDILKKQ
jgi:hypothetical protein